jgi:hypothetical protein
MLLWVPVAVRAAQPSQGSLSSTIRLNRGFDMPAQKQLVPPATAPSMVPDAVAHQDTTAVIVVPPACECDHDLPDSPDFSVPDPLRGPPAVSIA